MICYIHFAHNEFVNKDFAPVQTMLSLAELNYAKCPATRHLPDMIQI